MKEFIDKLISRLEEAKESAKRRNAFDSEVSYACAIDIVNKLAEEYINTSTISKMENVGWIPCSERLPSKEECGAFGSKEFQVTIPQHGGNKTISMHFAHETARGKEVARWKWRGSLSPWKVIAWKPLDAPYTEGE